MPVTYHTREGFLKEYSFPLKPAKDFERDGNVAEFASGHPWPSPDWRNFTEAIDFGKEMNEQSTGAYKSFHSAISSDGKLLAISSTLERILIYDIATKELRANLEGTGRIVFRPVRDSDIKGYTLISSISDHESRAGLSNNRLILWDLDQHGRLLDEEEPIDAAAFATKAINSILPELTSEHEWTKDFAQASNLHADFEKALSRVAADHRRRHHTILNNARLGNFDSVTFSDDGRLLLYHGENGTTQRNMREADKLPHVVVYDVDAAQQVHCLRGHTDAIMWSAFSPDNQHIASVSWDGTMRMYSASTGDLEWATDDSEGQSWAAAFTPDSRHIVWSSKSGRVVSLHNVSDGHKLSTFQGTFKEWCRNFVWDPTGEELALCAGKHAWIWRPFDGPDGVISQHFLLDEDKDWRMASIMRVQWMKNSKALALEFSDGTKLVYDTQTNSKEIFMRPKGEEGAYVDPGFYGVLSGPDQPEFYLSIDGDGKVRYIRTSVPAFPSWWEKEPEPRESTPAVKKLYPETGKYVKITKVSEKDIPKKDAGRKSWVEKGAELWTAE
jgi:WD40 repeat protein